MFTVIFIIALAIAAVIGYRRLTATPKQPQQPAQPTQSTQNTPSENTGVSGAAL